MPFTMLWLLAMSCLMLTCLVGSTGLADEATQNAILEEPRQSLERQIDRLDRQGEVDPLTRRRLRDELRRLPPGPERRRGERALRSVPDADGPGATPPAVPAPRLPPSDLPSTLPRSGLPSSLPLGRIGR